MRLTVILATLLVMASLASSAGPRDLFQIPMQITWDDTTIYTEACNLTPAGFQVWLDGATDYTLYNTQPAQSRPGNCYLFQAQYAGIAGPGDYQVTSYVLDAAGVTLYDVAPSRLQVPWVLWLPLVPNQVINYPIRPTQAPTATPEPATMTPTATATQAPTATPEQPATMTPHPTRTKTPRPTATPTPGKG